MKNQKFIFCFCIFLAYPRVIHARCLQPQRTQTTVGHASTQKKSRKLYFFRVFDEFSGFWCLLISDLRMAVPG